VKDALGQALEMGDAALGDASALGNRASAYVGEGTARLVGMFAPEAGSNMLQGVDAKRAAADETARRGLFTEATPASPAASAPQSAASAADAPATEAAPSSRAQPSRPRTPTPQNQSSGRSAVAGALGQQIPNLADLPLDMGASVEQEEGSPASRLNPEVLEQRRNVSTIRGGNAGGFATGLADGNLTAAQAERLAPLIGQEINAQGNLDAARIRSSQPQQVDPSKQAGQQIFNAATSALQQVQQDPEATPEERANALEAWRQDMMFLVQNGLSDVQGLRQMADGYGQ
jgi:hypothetical protein